MISISSPVVVRRGALRHYKTALKMQALGFIAATTGDVVVLPLTKPQRLRQERAVSLWAPRIPDGRCWGPCVVYGVGLSYRVDIGRAALAADCPAARCRGSGGAR
eukprot:m51a1_g13396 hypothetical protein (105) ;mRNA; f:1969-2283